MSPIYPALWEKIGTTPDDVDRWSVDEKLRQAALEFASKKGKYREVKPNWIGIQITATARTNG